MKREHLQITLGSKILTLLLFFSLSIGVTWSQVILSEDFSSASGSTPPTDWSNSDISSDGVVWAFDNPGGRTIAVGSTDFDDNFAILDSDEFCGSDEESSLETPEFDASAATGFLVLEFDNCYRYWGSEEAHVEVWDGTSWNSVLIMTSGHDGYPTANTKSIDITAAADGYADAKVRFRWANGSCDYYWAIDNVTISNVACMAPTSVSAGTVISSGATISWSGSGTYILEYGLAGFSPGTGSTAGAGGTIVNPATSPYEITGLSLSTEYDVYIRTICDDTYSENVSVSFTTAASAGTGCEDPIEITSLPYSHTSNTSEYGDNPDLEGSPGSSCGSTSSYLNGDDVVYEFTSSFTGPLDIELTDITDNYTGIFVYSSCDDIGVNCLDGGVTGSGTADILLEDFAVTEGATYYIVISTWASPQSTGYTLNLIPPPPCDDPDLVFPESILATATSEIVCASGTVNFGLDEEMPEATGITYIWEKSLTETGTYSTVSSELSAPAFTYEPADEDDGGYFRCRIYCNDEEIITSSTVFISVSVPVAPELTDVEQCGSGSVTLTGSIEDGTIYWYEEEVGGIPFATGDEISTPPISETTTFYATGGSSPSHYAQIGTSTNSTTVEDPGPFNNYYRKYTMQLLYKSDQIIAAGGTPGGMISELQFNLTGLPAYELPGYTISIKSVPSTMSTLTWQATGFTEIFGGSDFDYLPTSTGWQSYLFESPFTWDGSSHIVIQVCWSQISPDWDESGTHQYTSTSGQMLYNRSDSEGNACGLTGSSTSSYLPNAKFLFEGCETSREPVLALIHQVPEITFEDDEPSVCENQNIELIASSTESTDTIQWYASESAVTPLHTGSTYATPDLTETTTYYVSSSNANCSSERIAITVAVNAYPDIMADGAEVCSGNTVTLNATSSNEEATFTWYSTATSTEVLSSSASFTTPELTASTSYFVAANFNGCSSDRIEVEVTVNPSPEITATPEDEELCLFGSTTINATSSLTGTTFEWFADATGTEPLATGSAFETPVIFATTSYFVAGTSSDGCVSERQEVSITVNNPEITAENSYYICDPHSVTLTAEAAEGATIGWYESSSDEEPIATGSSFTTPVLSETTTYYVAATEDGCRSYMDAVTVYRETYDFEIEDFAFCPNEEYLAIPLSASTSPETTIYWYSDEALSDLIYTGESYIAPTPESTITYYVTAEGENCTTDPREVTITVYPLPSVNIEPESQIVCSGEFATFEITPLDEQTYEYIWTPTGTEGATLTTDQPGTHTVLITSVDYGCSITEIVVLDTVPAPYIAGFDYYPEIFTNPLLYVFSPTDSANITGYSWDFGDGHTSDEYEAHHEYDEFGTYTVTFHFYNECDTNSISLEIYVHPSTSIDNSELNQHVDVYPNPTHQDLNISITDGDKITKVSVYNHLGQLMLHEMVNNENKYSFSVASLAQGTYYILIDTKTGQQAIKKFVVQY